MSTLEFIAHIVSALAWPATAVTMAAIFRRQIATVIERLTRLRYKDLDVDFGHELKQLRGTAIEANVPPQLPAPRTDDPRLRPLELAERLAQDFPEAAVGSAWATVETVLYETLGRVIGNEGLRFDPYNPIGIARELRNRHFLDNKTLELLTEMRNLRNHAVHNPGHPGLGMSPEEAKEYVAHTRGIISHLGEISRAQGGGNAA